MRDAISSHEQPVQSHRSNSARSYNQIPIHAASGVHEGAFALLQRHQSSGTILDVGSGSGGFALRLHDHGYRVTGSDFDLSSWAVPQVQAIHLDLNTEFADHVDQGSLDALTAVEVIEHLENPTAFLRSAHRLIRPGGLILLTTPNVVNLESRRLMLTMGELCCFRRDSFYKSGHCSILPYWLLEQLLNKTGFSLVARSFIGAEQRPGWKKIVVPFFQFLLTPFAFGIPMAANNAVCVAIVAKKTS